MRTCMLCDQHHYARGYCQKHYARWRRTGDPIKNHRAAVPIGDRLRARLDMSDPDGCWPYRGGNTKSRSGHRQIWDNEKVGMVQVHRVAYELEHGPISDELLVCHTCDNPPCCRPSHLYVGTPADNNRDRDERGRHVPLPGSSNGNSKLIEADVVVIRRLRVHGMPQRRVAEEFGVSQGLINLIDHGRAWAHVPVETALSI